METTESLIHSRHLILPGVILIVSLAPSAIDPLVAISNDRWSSSGTISVNSPISRSTSVIFFSLYLIAVASATLKML